MVSGRQFRCRLDRSSHSFRELEMFHEVESSCDINKNELINTHSNEKIINPLSYMIPANEYLYITKAHVQQRGDKLTVLF